MLKGITPVIALVMLILITIGVVGLFYGWSSGLFSTQTEKVINIPTGGATCKSGLVTVRIVNVGSTATVTTSDIIVGQINGVECTTKNGALSIAPGAADKIIDSQGCAASCGVGTLCSGKVTVKVGTRNGVVDSSTYYA